VEGPVVREVQDVLKVRQRIKTLQIGGVSGGNRISLTPEHHRLRWQWTPTLRLRPRTIGSDFPSRKI
jgi:hypothetical protein